MSEAPQMPPGGKVITTDFAAEQWQPPTPQAEPSELPTLPEVGPRTLNEVEARQARIFATCRWAGVIAVTEMVDGFDAAMKVVEMGPEQFMPPPEEFDKINETGRRGIAFIEGTDQ